MMRRHLTLWPGRGQRLLRRGRQRGHPCQSLRQSQSRSRWLWLNLNLWCQSLRRQSL